MSLPELAEADEDGDGRIVAAEIDHETIRRYFQFFDLDQDGSIDAAEWETLRANLAAKNVRNRSLGPPSRRPPRDT